MEKSQEIEKAKKELANLYINIKIRKKEDVIIINNFIIIC